MFFQYPCWLLSEMMSTGGGGDRVDYIQSKLQPIAERIGAAPLDSPTTNDSFDGVREGVVSASVTLGPVDPGFR